MVLSKLFGTKSDREIKKLNPTVDKIKHFFESLSEKPDEDLVNRTQELKVLVKNAREDHAKSLPESMDREERQAVILKAE